MGKNSDYKVSYTMEEWIDIIGKNKILTKLGQGITYKALAEELNQKGIYCTGDGIRKAVKRLEEYGLEKHKSRNLYYVKGTQSEEAIKLMDSIDIESTIESISAKRYYDCAFEGGFFYREEMETEDVYVDKQIVKELEKLSEKFGVEYVEEYITYILLEHLEEMKPVNRLREFAYKYLNESDRYNDKEKEIIIKKEQEGFNLYDMVIHGLDNYIEEMTEEDFNKHISKEKYVEPCI